MSPECPVCQSTATKSAYSKGVYIATALTMTFILLLLSTVFPYALPFVFLVPIFTYFQYRDEKNKLKCRRCGKVFRDV